MILLALSTSTPVGSAAVLRDQEVLAVTRYEGGKGHAELLFASIDETMTKAGLRRADLGAIACDVGPGSFTGVRVSVATAKGVALALAIPTAAVLSLDAMLDAHARSRDGAGAPALAAIDAKKGELFVCARAPSFGEPLLSPRHIPRDEVGALIAALDADAGSPVALVGDVFAEVAGVGDRAKVGGAGGLPDAADVGLLAARLGRYVPPDDLDPVYVRAPDISSPRV